MALKRTALKHWIGAQPTPASIGVIYGGTSGNGTPLFALTGTATRTPTF